MEKQYIYPRIGVGVVIFSQDNKFLLMKRKNCRNDNGKYCVPGGAIEFGESPMDCAIREVKEETGLIIKDFVYDETSTNGIVFCSSDFFPDIKQHWITLFFVCIEFEGELKNLEPEKCEEIGWFGKENFPKKLLSKPLTSLLSSIDV